MNDNKVPPATRPLSRPRATPTGDVAERSARMALEDQASGVRLPKRLQETDDGADQE